MRILFLTQLLPYPLNSGGKIKLFEFLKAVSSRHETCLVSFSRATDEPDWACTVREVCRHIETVPLRRSRLKDARCLAKSVVDGQSFIVSRDFSASMNSKVAAVLSGLHFDVVHAVRPNMFQYVPEGTDLYKVLDTENVESRIVQRLSRKSPFSPRSLVYLHESRKLEKYEVTACTAADLVLTVTDNDREELVRLIQPRARGSRSPKIEVVPIGVDTEYFSRSWKDERVARCVFVGTMYWPPNVDSAIYFCEHILPLARKHIPELEFDIVGLRPAKAVLKLEKRIRGVRVFASVDDVRPYMSESRVFVVPLRAGSGMRVKILNAMAVGIPVVSTSVGCEGIAGLVPVKERASESDNRDANIWIADSRQDFSRAVVTLMKDDELARTLSRNGRKLMETAYDWSIIRRKIVSVYDEIEEEIERRRRSGAPR